MIATADTTGFLRAVVERPDDDLPRLVYADWLDEHGEPERAEFIRVQCELARIVTAPAFRKLAETIRPTLGRVTDELVAHGIEQRDDVAALRRRERDLLHHRAQAWLPTPPDGYHRFYTLPEECGWSPNRGEATARTCVLFSFARGFPSHLTLSWHDWQTHAAALLAACPIRRVNRPKDCACCLGRGGAYRYPSDDPANRLGSGDHWYCCQICDGTGKVDDWRGDGLVRLTDWPDDDWAEHFFEITATGDAGRYYCSPEWPGVRFELPAATRDASIDWSMFGSPRRMRELSRGVVHAPQD